MSNSEGGAKGQRRGQATPVPLEKLGYLSGASRLKGDVCSSQRCSIEDRENFTVCGHIPQVILSPWVIHKKFNESMQRFTALTHAAGHMAHVSTGLL